MALVDQLTGAGLGQSTARALGAEGATVVVTDRHAERTHGVAEDIGGGTTGRAVGMPLDVTDETAVIDVLGRIVDQLRQLTNELSPVWEMSTDSWRKVMEVSLNAHFWQLRPALTHMAQRDVCRRRRQSVAGWIGTDEGEAHYAAAKAGVMGLTRAAVVEAAKRGVRVDAVAPGLAWNELLFNSNSYREVVFLVSDKASFITGQSFSSPAACAYLHDPEEPKMPRMTAP